MIIQFLGKEVSKKSFLFFILFREMYRSKSETLQNTLEAIVEEDKHELLVNFLNDDKVNIIDDMANEKVPILKYIIEKRSLKCAISFISLGLKTEGNEQEELMRVALLENDLDLVEKIIDNLAADSEFEIFLRYAAEADNPEACRKILIKQKSTTSQDVIDFNQNDNYIRGKKLFLDNII